MVLFGKEVKKTLYPPVKNPPFNALCSHNFYSSFSHFYKHLNMYFFWGFVWFITFFSSLLHAKPFHPDQHLKKVKVQLNWNHQYQFAGFYAAKMQGYYKEIGLDVEINDREVGMNVLEAVVNGDIDYASSYSSIIGEFAQGAPIELVMASFQYSPMVLLSNSPIESLADLQGKTVMHNGGVEVMALIDKARVVNNEPLLEVVSSARLKDFKDKKIDLYAAYETNEPFRLNKAGINYSILDPKAYGVQGYGDLIFTSKSKVNNDHIEVEDFRNATIKGWEYAIENQEEVVDYIIQNYEVVKSREALLSEAKLTVKYIDTPDASIGQLDKIKLLETAKQVFQAGLMTRKHYEDLDLSSLVFKPIDLNLTSKEREYLENLPFLRVGNDHNWPPFDFINEDGEYDGIIADHMKWVAKSLHLELKTLEKTPWKQVLKDLGQGKLDVAPGAMDTPERREYLDFTEPYMSFPLVLMAREDVGFVNDLAQLDGHKVAVPEGWYTEELLRTQYPNIERVLVGSMDEGLEAVINRKANFYLGNLAAINYQIKKRRLTGLKAVSTVLDSGFLLTMAVNKENNVLKSILQKALDSMPETEKKRIYDRWINLQVVNKQDYSLLIKWGIGAVGVILLLTLLLLLLHRQKHKQGKYINQVNELSMASYTDFKTRKLKWVSDSFLKLTGYSREEMLDNSHNILKHPDVEDSFYEHIYSSIERGEVWSGEVRAQTKEGLDYWVDVVYSPDFKNKKVVGVWATRADITDKKRIEELAIIDSLTGVYNRNQFNEIFDAVVEKASRNHSRFAMIMFDLDEFKKINDRFGHTKGDEVLKAVLDKTKEFFNRGSDQIFRVGGEEFVVLTDATSFEGLAEYLEKFRVSVEQLNIPNPDSRLKVVTVSVGAMYCDQLTTMIEPNLIYSYVDEQLYKAKETGRNRVELGTTKRYCLK